MSYILSTAAVSPQQTFQQLRTAPALYSGDRFSCIEPDYSKYIDAKQIRRMSRIIKMGVAAAMETLHQAAVKNPDAIITGTAYGCLADTDAFLTRLVEYNEELLSPTAFIQSTHNTVGAQIALQLKCHAYNNTFVHRGASFEAALLDAHILMNEGDAGTVLVGAADEITERSHTILNRFGIYKQNGNSKTLFTSATTGTMAGEGAAFFLLSHNLQPGAIAQLADVKAYQKTQTPAAGLISDFLMQNNLTADDLDVIILGCNGDRKTDQHYYKLAKNLFPGKPLMGYKNYCGEYPTSAAFALWLAASMMAHNKNTGNQMHLKKILIYNNYMLQYPSLYLLSAC